MKHITILLFLVSSVLVGCGEKETIVYEPRECTVTDVDGGVIMNCGDGDIFIADGQDGADGSDGVDGIDGVDGVDGIDGVDGVAGNDGQDGSDGADGEDAVVYSEVSVPAGQCVQVADGVWVENIQNGRLIDVYMNDQCADNLGEYCDNVVPSYGRSGRLDDYPHTGSGTTCWADDLLILAHKPGKNDVDLTIKILDFN